MWTKILAIAKKEFDVIYKILASTMNFVAIKFVLSLLQQ